jgi:ABC-type oligopeptide transport system substrate-binding subunit
VWGNGIDRLTRILLLAGVLSTAMWLSGCGTSVSTPSSRSGLAIWDMVGRAPLTLDPAVAISAPAVQLVRLTNLGLVQMARLQVAPAAAESWKTTDGGRRYVFKLRPGLRFSNGHPLTAKDAVQSLQRATRRLSVSRVLAPYMADVARRNGVPEIQALPRGRLSIQLVSRSPSFLTRLTLPSASIVDMSTVRQFGAVWPEHANGLGPYRLTSWSPGEASVTLVRNHYSPTSVSVSPVKLNFVHKQAAIPCFAQSRCQLVSGIAPSQGLMRRFPDGYRQTPTSNLDYIAMNTSNRWLADKAVRRALALSVDRQQLVRGIFHGGARPEASVVPSALLPGEEGQAFSPRGAQQQFDEARSTFRHGQARKQSPAHAWPPELTLVYPKSKLDHAIAEYLVDSWADGLALHVRLRGLPTRKYLQVVTSRHFDLAFVRWGVQYLDATDYLDVQLERSSPLDLSGWSNPYFAGLMRRADVQATNSPVRRQDLLAAAQLAANEAPWVPLDSPERAILSSSSKLDHLIATN